MGAYFVAILWVVTGADCVVLSDAGVVFGDLFGGILAGQNDLLFAAQI